VQAVFGLTGFVTYRFKTFRIVASIYTIVFALLIPLVGYCAYRMLSFAYPGLFALLVVDLAIANALNLTYWWWPGMAMILPIAATFSIIGFSLVDVWEWPLLAVGLVYGIAVSIYDVTNDISAVQYTFGIHSPFALEIALLAATWYAASALTKMKL
jgi:hypothetical protein